MPATNTPWRVASAAATPMTRLAVETMPSLAPRLRREASQSARSDDVHDVP